MTTEVPSRAVRFGMVSGLWVCSRWSNEDHEFQNANSVHAALGVFIVRYRVANGIATKF